MGVGEKGGGQAVCLPGRSQHIVQIRLVKNIGLYQCVGLAVQLKIAR